MGAIAKITPENDPRERGSDQQESTPRLWQIVGAIKLGNRLAETLSAQAIHALEQVRDEKLYVAAGFSTFDSFLDQHPESPMKHEAFRRRLNLLTTEGDLTFDLLNALNVPMSARKLLAGQMSVQGKEITIGDSKCSLDDEAGIIVLINTLHAKAQEQSRTIERGKKDIDKYKRKLDEANEQLSRGVTVSENGAPHARALVSVLGSFQLLTHEVGALNNRKELKRFAPIAMKRIAEARQQLEAAFGFKGPEVNLGLDENDEAELLAAED